MPEELSILVAKVNDLRYKALNSGPLTDDEVREGIALIVAIRQIRAGGKGQSELPPILQGELKDIF